MSSDLEAQLQELGPECRAVVNRLRAGRTVGSLSATAAARTFPRRRPVVWLVAATLVLALALAVHFLPPGPSRASLEISPPREYALADSKSAEAIAEMIASQRSDGGWQNDFLTRRNAEALRDCTASAARIAYKRAVRNLRLKGLL